MRRYSLGLIAARRSLSWRCRHRDAGFAPIREIVVGLTTFTECWGRWPIGRGTGTSHRIDANGILGTDFFINSTSDPNNFPRRKFFYRQFLFDCIRLSTLLGRNASGLELNRKRALSDLLLRVAQACSECRHALVSQRRPIVSHRLGILTRYFLGGMYPDVFVPFGFGNDRIGVQLIFGLDGSRRVPAQWPGAQLRRVYIFLLQGGSEWGFDLGPGGSMRYLQQRLSFASNPTYPSLPASRRRDWGSWRWSSARALEIQDAHAWPDRNRTLRAGLPSRVSGAIHSRFPLHRVFRDGTLRAPHLLAALPALRMGSQPTMTDANTSIDNSRADPLAGLRYAAFISYSHKDAALARWLHASLERFRVPDELRSESARKRLSPIFRDEADLAGSASLSSAITEALPHRRP